MKRIPVDECPTGPWLDAAVEVQLGRPGRFCDYVYINGKRYDIKTWIPEGFTPEDPPAGQSAGRMPKPYSIEIMVAWILVEELKMRCGYSHQRHEPFAMLECEEYGTLVQYADEVPLAITRAYLKTKGVEYIEVDE